MDTKDWVTKTPPAIIYIHTMPSLFQLGQTFSSSKSVCRMNKAPWKKPSLLLKVAISKKETDPTQKPSCAEGTFPRQAASLNSAKKANSMCALRSSSSCIQDRAKQPPLWVQNCLNRMNSYAFYLHFNLPFQHCTAWLYRTINYKTRC